MSTTTAALIVLAVLVVSLAGAYELVDRAKHRESTRDRIVRQAHEQAETARGWDAIAIAWDLPPYAGPEPAAALERLRQDINDQHKGEL